MNGPGHIEVRELSMAYGDFVVQRGLNFTVNQGDIFVVMGGNGCGKTTLMRALVGLQRPAAGSVLYSGEDFWNAAEEEQQRLKRRLGILFQGGALWSSLTLAENVALPIAEYTGLPPARVNEIGAFVLGAIALAIITTLLLAGGSWFSERRQHVLYFTGAAQGLQVGAPVVFLGVKVGTVKQIQLGLDAHSHRFLVPVMIEVQPHVVHTHGGENVDLRDRATVRQLVDRGLRGRLRLQSLLTGQLYVDLDFHPDKRAIFAALDPELSEIPTIRTAVQELTTKLEGFPMDQFLADVAAISSAVSKLMSAQATQDLPRRLDATLRHLESLARRFDAQGGPILKNVRDNLTEMNKALLAAQAALARLDTAAERVADLARADSRMVAGMTQASEELARAAGAVRKLTEQESPTVDNVNAALKEIARAADALRLLAETLEQQPDAIWRGKRQQTAP